MKNSINNNGSLKKSNIVHVNFVNNNNLKQVGLEFNNSPPKQLQYQQSTPQSINDNNI